MKPIDLAGFEGKFSGEDDPWSTFTDRDEARKRLAIGHCLGSGPVGRVLELAAGNGSNSVMLARTARWLDATEGTESGTELVRRAFGQDRHVHVSLLVMPYRFPGFRYDAVVVAEVLYYLTQRDMALVARRVAAALRPGGTLVLAHHRVDYPDFVQHADAIHTRFLAATAYRWRAGPGLRTGRWRVQSFYRKSG